MTNSKKSKKTSEHIDLEQPLTQSTTKKKKNKHITFNLNHNSSESQPIISDTQPTISDNQPTISDTQPTISDNQQTISDVQPIISDVQPNLDDVQPIISDVQPNLDEVQPIISDVQPNLDEVQPNLDEMQPNLDDVQPIISDVQPIVSDVQPIVSDVQPIVSDVQSNLVDVQQKEEQEYIKQNQEENNDNEQNKFEINELIFNEYNSDNEILVNMNVTSETIPYIVDTNIKDIDNDDINMNDDEYDKNDSIENENMKLSEYNYVIDHNLNNGDIKIPEEQYKKCAQVFGNCYNQNISTLKYFPCSGIPNSKLTTYTEYIHDRAKIFFRILDKYSIPYMVFAGSSIGYLRNKKNIPWADDYDIILFNEHVQRFLTKVLPILVLNEFNWFKTSFGIAIISAKNDIEYNKNQMKGYFQCDIFYSTYKSGLLRNALCQGEYGGGLYNRKKVPKNLVEPKVYNAFDGIVLPFFNKIDQDVKLEYGDIYNKCVIHVKHRVGGEIKGNWEHTYKFFNEIIINNAKNNVKKLIYVNPHYNATNKMKLDDSFKSMIDVLKYISEHNIKTIYVLSSSYIKNLQTIKYYYPETYIILYIFNDNTKCCSYLNYVDEVKFKYQSTLDYYNNNQIEYIKKPKFKIINVITFGTFDLLHIGHINIIKRAKQYGNNLYIGISSEELNIKKNKQQVQDYETILKNVLDLKLATLCFKEESLELKNHYITKYDCDILVMGDDWKDKFDWVNCPVLYLPRTENISSTIIKSKINNNEPYKHLLYDKKKTEPIIKSQMTIKSEIIKILNPKKEIQKPQINYLKSRSSKVIINGQNMYLNSNKKKQSINKDIREIKNIINPMKLKYVLHI